MVLKISSKFELRRFCRTTGAVALVSIPTHDLFGVRPSSISNIVFKLLQQLKLSRPSPDNLGYVDSVSVEEIGGVRVCLFMWIDIAF